MSECHGRSRRSQAAQAGDAAARCRETLRTIAETFSLSSLRDGLGSALHSLNCDRGGGDALLLVEDSVGQGEWLPPNIQTTVGEIVKIAYLPDQAASDIVRRRKTIAGRHSAARFARGSAIARTAESHITNIMELENTQYNQYGKSSLGRPWRWPGHWSAI